MLREDFAGRVLPFDSAAGSCLCRDRGHPPRRWPPRRTDGCPDGGNRPVSRHGAGDTQHRGLHRHGRRSPRPMVGRLSRLGGWWIQSARCSRRASSSRAIVSNGTTPITLPTRSTAIDLTLLGLSFGVAVQPGVGGVQQYLERVDPLGVRGDRDHCHDPSHQPCGAGVGAVVAHDHRWPTSGRLGADDGTEVDDADLPSPHQPWGRPSATAASHARFSVSSAHSSKAAA